MASQAAQLRTPNLSPIRTIQQDIRSMESGIDEVLAGNFEMLGRMMRVAGQAGLKPEDGHPAILSAFECAQLGLTLRAKTINAHESLRVAVGKMDLKTLGYGGYVGSPSLARAAEAPARLHAVSTAE